MKKFRYIVRYLLLTTGFALTTYGLIEWQQQGFGFQGMWSFENGFKLHPLHFIVVGIAMIPPSLWEVFLLDAKRYGRD